jgi:hypothetical protein
MGIDLGTIQFLLNAKRMGVSLDRVLTIGRQHFYVSPEQLHDILNRNNRPCSFDEARRLWNEEKGYCEPFLKFAGAGDISSMDVSPYENATILHDMNQPLPSEWNEKFTLVFDGGSLEHVFQYPTALSNCMRAVQAGGHLLTITPANNLMGHGFYQFSPELFYRVLSPENGFEMTRLLVYELPFNGTWYQVADPARVHGRVELTNRKHAYLIACAQRKKVVPIFSTTPQQSDYMEMWQAGAEGPRAKGWKQRLPSWVGDLYRSARPFRPRCYRPVSAALDSNFWNGD